MKLFLREPLGRVGTGVTSRAPLRSVLAWIPTLGSRVNTTGPHGGAGALEDELYPKAKRTRRLPHQGMGSSVAAKSAASSSGLWARLPKRTRRVSSLLNTLAVASMRSQKMWLDLSLV